MWYPQDPHKPTLNSLLTQKFQTEDNEKERVTFRSSNNKSICARWIIYFKPSIYFQPKSKETCISSFSLNPIAGGSLWAAISLLLLALEKQIESENIKLVYLGFSLEACKYV